MRPDDSAKYIDISIPRAKIVTLLVTDAGSIAVALFNRGDEALKMTAMWSDLGIDGKQRVSDLWRQKDLGTYDSKFSAKVERHGVVMVRMVEKR
jgi:hypothetical protein